MTHRHEDVTYLPLRERLLESLPLQPFPASIENWPVHESYRLSVDSEHSLGAIPEHRRVIPDGIEAGDVMSKCECRGVGDIILGDVDDVPVPQLDVAYFENL
jgi:hypothetical protein